MRRIHTSLGDESYEFVQQVAYEARVSISCVIDALIYEDLVELTTTRATAATETLMICPGIF